MKLNLGCGDHPARHRMPEWVDVDAHEGDGTDPSVVADIRDLPFEDDTAQQVYCGHVLEHLTKDDCLVALSEIERVLKPGGVLMVVGPDAARARSHFPEALPDIENGASRWPGDAHLWIPTEESTVALLQRAGWTTLSIPIAKVNGREWPVTSFIGWQTAVECRPVGTTL